MKKALLIVLALLLVVSSVAGCSGKKVVWSSGDFSLYATSGYQPFLLAGINNKYLSDHLKVKTLWDTGSFQRKDAASEKSCTVNGVTYQGTYVYSVYRLEKACLYDFYQSTDNEQPYFAFRADTGELVYYNGRTQSYDENEIFRTDLIPSEEAAAQLAIGFARSYVNPDEYEMTLLDTKENQAERDGTAYTLMEYRFRFVRKLNGFDTSDDIIVNVNSKGNIASFDIGDTGVYNGFTGTIDMNAVWEAVKAQIEKLYSKPVENYTGIDHCENEGQTVYLTPKGEIVVVTSIGYDLKQKDSEKLSHSSLELGVIVGKRTMPADITR